jgi:CheY-like chemotaxis protein
VLIVDDVDMNRDVCYEMLRMFGCTVAEAGDGVAAVSAVREARARGRPFDAVLMDVQMPHKNGTEATAAIRVMEAEADRILGVVERLPIVALTGSAATPTTPHTHSPLDACMDACTVLTVWCVTLCALQVRRLGGARALPGQRDGRLHDQADRLRRDSSHPERSRQESREFPEAAAARERPVVLCSIQQRACGLPHHEPRWQPAT